MEADCLLVSLRMEAAYIKKLFSFNWVCQFGLVESIEVVVQEYRQSRGLLVCSHTHETTYSVHTVRLYWLICVFAARPSVCTGSSCSR